MRLTVLEHQKLYIGKTRNLARPQISYVDADAMRIIDLNNAGIFRWGNNFVQPKQWVGVISLPGLSIEILPKVSDSYDEIFIKETLLYMFKVANNIPTKKNVRAKVEFTKNGLVEILITNYLEYVEYYLRQGLTAEYCKVTKNLTAVKGSIDFAKQINRNILNPTRFICRYSRLEVDNPINQLIKYTLHQMQKVSRDYNNIKRIRSASIYFEDVKILDEGAVRNLKIQINRINKRVGTVVDYSYLFLNGYSVSVNNGHNEVSSMLFDMNKVFEDFIYRYYKKIFGSQVLYQCAKNYLITDKANSIHKINLKPDLLITLGPRVKMVIDTKWKNVRAFVKESDVYQMNAYVSAINDVDTAVLMYPKTIESDSAVGDYDFLNTSGKKELKVRTVDLSLIGNETAFINHLKDLVT